jgi:hypothetical protein
MSNSSRPVRWRWSIGIVVVAALGLAAGCTPSGSASSPPASTTTTTIPGGIGSKPCGRSTSPPERYDHVVVMLMENRTWTGGRSPAIGLGFDAKTMPYLHGLATQCSYYTDWSETDGTQNSLNQYIGLTSGVGNSSTVNDCTPSATCRSTDDNIFRQVRTAGGTARNFVDGADAPCSVGSNKAKHIPALYFQGGDDAAHCSEIVRPLSELDHDHLPTFAFISPDQCNDGHDCGDDQVDAFARTTLGPILAGRTYQEGRTLVAVVYDEDRPVPNLLIAPTAHAGSISTVTGTHAGLLKTIQELLGLPVLSQGQLPVATSLRSSAHL